MLKITYEIVNRNNTMQFIEHENNNNKIILKHLHLSIPRGAFFLRKNRNLLFSKQLNIR